MRRHSTFALLAAVLCSAALHAENWPRFRGPNGVGITTGKDIPSAFSDTKNIAWKLKIPGKGNSSPIVWEDSLFLQTSSADGAERFLVCIDAVKGDIRWQRSIPGKTAKTHSKNTLASATPATDGELVYAAFWDGEDVSLWAYDFKGNPKWHRDLGKFVSQHGAGASPVIYKNLVYFANDMDGKATLFCFDKKTGTDVWSKEREAFRACYGAPFILSGKTEDADELIVTSTTCITSYRPATGEVLWNWKWDWSPRPDAKKKGFPLRTICATMPLDGMFFACSGDGGGDRYMTALNMNGTGKGATLKKAWDNTKDFPYVPCLLHRDGYIYFVNDAGFAGCYEAKTGERQWFERADTDKCQFTASPVMIDDRIVACSEEGDVFVFRADPAKYTLLAKNPMGEMFRASPAVANGRLYLRGANHLFCVGKK